MSDTGDEGKSIDGHLSFREYVKEMSSHYNSTHLLMMVGSGLNFEKAELYLSDIKRLIDHFNSVHQDILVVFSTLSFFDRAISASKPNMPVTYGDDRLITYSQDGLFYNSGIYTSRQNLKGYVRRASQVLHVASKVYQARLLEIAGQALHENKTNAKQ